MANKKLFKSKGNFTIKRLHQSGSYGSIYERDYTTIANSSAIPSGQIPIYNSPSFKLSIRGNINKQKKYRYSNWINNPETCNSNSNIWTLGCMPTPNTNDGEIVLKLSKTQLTDYVCYGSAYELIKVSVNNIVSKFPAEIHISNMNLDDMGILDIGTIPTDSFLYVNKDLFKGYYIVRNPFYIDIIQSIIPDSSKVSPLRYICNSQYDYNIINTDNEVVVDGNEIKKWNEENPNDISKKLWSVIYYSDDKKCLENGDLIAKASFHGLNGDILHIYCFYYEGDILYLSDTKGYKIRPNKNSINKFFNDLSDFEKVLLNQYTNYTANFQTYIEDEEKGWYFTNEVYKWPIGEGGWNIEVNGKLYLDYVEKLNILANGYDTLFTNAIWNNMTHEAISNMDLTEKIDSDNDVIHNPAKMRKFLNIVGRQFDEIKKYADNIKNTNNVSYDEDKNIPDYFISDVLNLNGWETKEILNDVPDDIITEPIYSSRTIGYKASDANNEFMRRLKLNSKGILSSKGTKRCIEDLLAIFGFHSIDWLLKYYNVPTSKELRSAYILNEYVYVANGYDNDTEKVDSICENVKRINQLKDSYSIDNINSSDYSNDEYQGIPVAEVMFDNKSRLVPWFDKNGVYDNGMYFQMKGGWARNDGSSEELSKYETTVSKINFVNSTDELFKINYSFLNEGDIYYVNGENSYYKLNNIDKHNTIEGWKKPSVKEINELESVIDNNKGNNPHHGNYDNGRSYFNLMRNFFESATFNNAIDSEIENKDYYGFLIQRQNDNIKTMFYDNSSFFKNYIGLRGKITVEPYNFFGDTNPFSETSSLSVINSKEFHIIFDIAYREFIENDIIPYLKQIIPSTTIFSYSFEHIEDYDDTYKAKISDTICLNGSCPINGIVY